MNEIIIRKNKTQFSRIYLNTKHIGSLEDTGDYNSVAEILKAIAKSINTILSYENQIVITEQFE